MPALVAALVVFFASAAVLMLEIMAGRLLAPYVGITLETYTAIIGTVLAGIAAGSWAGGWLADRVDPRRILGPALVLGGALSLASVPIVRALGDATTQDVRLASVSLVIAGFFLPALVLSSVTPTVVKLQLRDLQHAGSIVGRLSALGTLGALVGTFATGFVLAAEFPTRPIIYGLGGALVAAGVALWLWLSRRGKLVMALLGIGTGVGGGFAFAAAAPCDVESPYSCLRVTRTSSSSGRLLWMNRDMHAYVDLDDPKHLEWSYTQAMADVAEIAWPNSEAVDILHIGGGGFTLPRYFAATHPGSRSTVLELDPGMVRVARERLALETSRSLRVKVGDARTSIRAVPTSSMDLVIGDAFADLSVPWHLTTREFVREIDRTLRPEGVYTMNVIDAWPLRFLKAQMATLQERFTQVIALGHEISFRGGFTDNIVLVASDRTLDQEALDEAAQSIGWIVLDGARLDRFLEDAEILTDDFAPVDQWLLATRD